MLLLTALLLQAVQPSPPAKQAPTADIVVEGRTDAAVRDFIRQLADPIPGDQLPRWDRFICPGIVGLARDQAELVNDRIAQLASTVHLRSGKPGCTPTILIAFTTNADALANAVADKYPITLRLEGSHRLSSFRQPQAVRWIGLTYQGPAYSATNDSDTLSTGSRLPPGGSAGYSHYATRINRTTQAILFSMLVVVDPTKLGSVKLDALADYLTMVVLARPPLGGAAPSTSILSLFAHGDPSHRAITRYDQDYLRALYTAPANQGSSMQASAIMARMKKAQSVEH